MKFTNHIGHYCIRGALLNVHRPPETIKCGNSECGQGSSGEHHFHLTQEIAKKVGVDFENPKCPKCGGAMEHSGPVHFGELHLTICLDERVHMLERHAKKEISDEEFEAWKKTLTERELLGFFDVKTHHMIIRLDPAEIDAFEADRGTLVESLRTKIEARLEIDAQFQIQHRHTVKQHNVGELFKRYLR